MSIKQINASYLVNEDRILFRFNTQDHAEYRLWLTRRVTLFILAAGSHLLAKKLEENHSPDAARALNEFENESILEAAKTANAGQQSYESGTQFPIGSDPLLVMDVTCSLMKNGEPVGSKVDAKEHAYDDGISIDFILAGGANLNLKLAGNMMRAMSLLLNQLRIQAGWGEALLTTKNLTENTSENEANSSNQDAKNISLH